MSHDHPSDSSQAIYHLLLLSLLATATLPSAEAQYCLAGAATTCNSVFAVCATQKTWCDDVRTTLLGTGAFATVDTFDASTDTPNSSQLAAYHAAFVFSDNGRGVDFPGFKDPVLLGNRLATYHDQGGGVVVAWKANMNGASVRLDGAYGSNGYALTNWPTGTWIYSSDSLGWFDTQSPLMKDVRNFAATNAFQSTAALISGRGQAVAFWKQSQYPLVVWGTKGNRTLVELNFFPVTSAVNDWFSGWTGDGAQLMRNALKFSRCMPCHSGTYAPAGTTVLWVR